LLELTLLPTHSGGCGFLPFEMLPLTPRAAWHAHDCGITTELPEASMDVDPITDSDEIAAHCYEALIGSEFERTHGWHINLMPETVLQEFPPGWEQRATIRQIGRLRLTVPTAADLLAPKLRRNEPRDRAHEEWARRIGLLG